MSHKEQISVRAKIMKGLGAKGDLVGTQCVKSGYEGTQSIFFLFKRALQNGFFSHFL